MQHFSIQNESPFLKLCFWIIKLLFMKQHRKPIGDVLIVSMWYMMFWVTNLPGKFNYYKTVKKKDECQQKKPAQTVPAIQPGKGHAFVHYLWFFISRILKNQLWQNVLGSSNLNAKLLRERLRLLLKYTENKSLGPLWGAGWEIEWP